MSRLFLSIALLIAAALTLDSLISVPMYGLQWHSPEWMAQAITVFNVTKLLLMAVITGYLWWAIPKCEFPPLMTMALQFFMLLCAIHTLALLVGRQNLLNDEQSIHSVGPIAVVTVNEQDSRVSNHVVYLRCQRPLGFYSLHELLYLPNQNAVSVSSKQGGWYLYADREYKLIDDSAITTTCN
ncbi:hypothetical protein [Pseudoalteromonas pernae]|uniref:hypothetical protein n=1 Tax=Pseudoalteromonas pernae TaxID=3118054 RepID=UPI0032427F0B